MQLEEALLILSLVSIFLAMGLSFYAAIREYDSLQTYIDIVMRMSLGMLLGTVIGWFTQLFFEKIDLWYLSFVGALLGTLIGYAWGYLPDFRKAHINSRFTEAAEFLIIAVISMGVAGAAGIFMLIAVNEIGIALIR